MNLNELIGTGGISAVVLLTLVQIAPIKVNPWTWLARTIGKAINGDVLESLKAVEARVDENEIDRLRWEILDFANSCRNHRKHTLEEYEHILDMHAKYESILKRNGKGNGRVTRAYEYIKGLYDERNDQNDFLP